MPVAYPAGPRAEPRFSDIAGGTGEIGYSQMLQHAAVTSPVA